MQIEFGVGKDYPSFLKEEIFTKEWVYNFLRGENSYLLDENRELPEFPSFRRLMI